MSTVRGQAQDRDELVYLRPECPPVRPGTNNALADYADLVVWDGRTYVSEGASKTAKLGRQVGRVRCNVSDLTASNGFRVGPPPWPDGTATGSAIFAVRGSDTRCTLGADNGDTVTIFTATKIDTPNWEPLC